MDRGTLTFMALFTAYSFDDHVRLVGILPVRGEIVRSFGEYAGRTYKGSDMVWWLKA